MRRSCGLKSSGAGRTMASSSSETSLHFSLRAWWLTTMSTTCCRLLENTCRGTQLTAESCSCSAEMLPQQAGLHKSTAVQRRCKIGCCRAGP